MPVFTCLKPDCGFNTPGIVRDVSSNKRWCPRCLSPLIQCNHCNGYVSGTINTNTEEETICDRCGNAVASEYARLTMPWHSSFADEKEKETISIEPVDFKCTITIDGVPYEL